MVETIERDAFTANKYVSEPVKNGVIIDLTTTTPTYIDSIETPVRKLRVPDVSGEVPRLVTTEIEYVIEVKPPLLKKFE